MQSGAIIVETYFKALPMNPSPNLILTLTGPSTAGKTVLSTLLEERGFAALVSTTTRPIRKGETDGVHYHFLTHKDFYQKLSDGDFIEFVEYDNNAYGICSEEAKKAFENGKPAILVAEPHGSEQIHNYCQQHGWTSVRVFVNNPIPVLLSRLLRRFAFDADATKNMDADVSDELTPAIETIRETILGDLGANRDETVADIMTRHLHTFSRMIPVGVSSEKLAELTQTHGRRISKIIDQEQEEWVKPAYAANSPYDLVIDTFNAGNTDEMVQRVLDLAETAMAPKEQARPKSPRA